MGFRVQSARIVFLPPESCQTHGTPQGSALTRMHLALLATSPLGRHLGDRFAQQGLPCLMLPHEADAAQALLAGLAGPRQLWLESGHADHAESWLAQLGPQLHPGDLLVDCGQGDCRHSRMRAQMLDARRIGYLDVGVAGNAWGVPYGFALMAGGTRPQLERAAPALDALAPVSRAGWLHCGGVGAGHFVRQIQHMLEEAAVRTFAGLTRTLTASSPLGLDTDQLTRLWQENTALRHRMTRLANAYSETDQPAAFEPYPHGLAQPTRPAVSPATALANLIRLASHAVDEFETRLVASLRGTGRPAAAES